MKKVTFSLLAVLGFAGASFAGTAMVSSKEYKAPVETTPCFKDTEFQIDLFGAYNGENDHHGDQFRSAWGGGVGANFFFARYFGIGIQGDWSPSGINRDVVHDLNGSVILRYPLELASHICLAPYVFGGGGGRWDGTSIGEGHVGGGLEYRATQHIGIFSDGRYDFNSNHRDDAQVRIGLRFAL